MKLYCVVIYVTSSYIWQTQSHRSSFILRITYPLSSVTPPLAGPSGRRPPGMWRSPEQSPRQWWSTWPEGHSRGKAPVVATSKRQSSATRATSTLAYWNPSPSSHGSEMVKSDRRGLILTKPKPKPNRSAAGWLRDIIYSVECEFFVDVCLGILS